MIGTLDYKFLSDTLSEAQDSGRGACDTLFRSKIVINDASLNRLDANKQSLEGFINSTYTFIFFKHIPFQRPLINAVKALNDHVLKTYKTLTVDEFLQKQYLEVPLTFAAISDEAGFSIAEIGTKSAFWQDIDDNWKDINHVKWNRIGWTTVC